MAQRITGAPRAVATAGPTTIPIEADGWWERERSRLLIDQLDLRGDLVCLDVGCGPGWVPSRMAEHVGLCVAVDLHRYEEWANASPGVLFVVASADALPFRDGALDQAWAFDVIEHLADEGPTLKELRRVVRAGGSVAVTVPAFRPLWSAHDDAVGHYRRYVGSWLADAMARASIPPHRMTYFFAWLAPIAYVLRHHRSDVGTGSEGGIVRAASAVASRAERWWLRKHSLPFGTSLLAVARRAPAERSADSLDDDVRVRQP